MLILQAKENKRMRGFTSTIQKGKLYKDKVYIVYIVYIRYIRYNKREEVKNMGRNRIYQNPTKILLVMEKEEKERLIDLMHSSKSNSLNELILELIREKVMAISREDELKNKVDTIDKEIIKERIGAKQIEASIEAKELERAETLQQLSVVVEYTKKTEPAFNRSYNKSISMILHAIKLGDERRQAELEAASIFKVFGRRIHPEKLLGDAYEQAKEKSQKSDIYR